MAERPPARRVTGGTRSCEVLFRPLMAGLAGGTRHVVTVRTVHLDMAGNGFALTEHDLSPAVESRLDIGVENAGAIESLRRDLVAGSVVTCHAIAAATMCFMVEVLDVGIDLAVMAVKASRVRDICRSLRKRWISGEMNPDLFECDELVREIRNDAWIDMALDTAGLTVWPGLPRRIVRRHLMTGIAEGRSARIHRGGRIEGEDPQENRD